MCEVCPCTDDSRANSVTIIHLAVVQCAITGATLKCSSRGTAALRTHTLRISAAVTGVKTLVKFQPLTLQERKGTENLMTDGKTILKSSSEKWIE
jgi:hypothetical protein